MGSNHPGANGSDDFDEELDLEGIYDTGFGAFTMVMYYIYLTITKKAIETLCSLDSYHIFLTYQQIILIREHILELEIDEITEIETDAFEVLL